MDTELITRISPIYGPRRRGGERGCNRRHASHSVYYTVSPSHARPNLAGRGAVAGRLLRGYPAAPLRRLRKPPRDGRRTRARC